MRWDDAAAAVKLSMNIKRYKKFELLRASDVRSRVRWIRNREKELLRGSKHEFLMILAVEETPAKLLWRTRVRAAQSIERPEKELHRLSLLLNASSFSKIIDKRHRQWISEPIQWWWVDSHSIIDEKMLRNKTIELKKSRKSQRCKKTILFFSAISFPAL